MVSETQDAQDRAVATSVRCRFRPQNSREVAGRCIKPLMPPKVHFVGPDGTENVFCYDAVYGEATKQAEVFKDITYVVDSVLKGNNGTILAYGQTGSGKTHTLIGHIEDEEQQGMVPRAIRHLAHGMTSNMEPGVEYKVNLSVVEIYCERIRDLLDPASDNLQVKQDATRGIYIEGVTEMAVTDEQQLVVFMQHGLAQRSVSATAMNSESSRSHCIVTVHVEKVFENGNIQEGKLCMVDLAGSERQSKTGAAGVTLAEGSQINKSLSCLANVIYALTEKDKARHVPYRDSKLTRVLQDSLGGTARTVLIICCSPCQDNAAETLSTLRFGTRAKGVTNSLQVNQRLSAEQLQQQLGIMTARTKELEAQLSEMRAAAVVGLPALMANLALMPAADELQVSSGTSGATEQASPEASKSPTALGPVEQRRVHFAIDIMTAILMLLGLTVYIIWEDAMPVQQVPCYSH